MKKMIIAAAALAALSMTGCNETARLAKSVDGSWSSSPMQLYNEVGKQSSVVETFLFINEAGTPGGTLTIQSQISQQREVGDNSLTAPLSTTIAATSTISGTWTAIDDDEITVVLDPSTFMLQVDPEDVELVANPLTGSSESVVDSLKPSVVTFLTADLTGTMKAHYQSYSILNDVDVENDGQLLKIEVGKKDIVLRKQQ